AHPQLLDDQLAAAGAGVLQDVARQLAGGGDDLGPLHHAEPGGAGVVAHQLARAKEVRLVADAAGGPRRPRRPHLEAGRAHRAFVARCSRWRRSIPLPALRAVWTCCMSTPSSMSVIATAGWMPTTTASAPSRRTIATMRAMTRAMNESTTV